MLKSYIRKRVNSHCTESVVDAIANFMENSPKAKSFFSNFIEKNEVEGIILGHTVACILEHEPIVFANSVGAAKYNNNYLYIQTYVDDE